MTRKRDKPPPPIVCKAGGRLSAVSAWDAELLDGYPEGMTFDLVARGKRSTPHNSMYWAQLGLIVKATGTWATDYKMHEWVKLKLGYVSPVFGPGQVVAGMTIDSTAFDAMTQAEFNVFYEKAAALIAAEMGINLADVVPGYGG